MTPYERVVAERLQAEAARIALPSRERWVPAQRRSSVSWPLLAAATALIVVLSTIAILGESAQAPVGRAIATLRSIVRPQAQTVPPSWNVFVERGVLIAVPPEYGTPTQPGMILGPTGPTAYLQFDSGLSIVLWPGRVRSVLDEQWLKGNLQPYTRRSMTGRDGEEVVVCCITRRSAQGSGTYEARHLFVQLDRNVVADVAMLPPDLMMSPGEAKLSTSDRAIQDQIGSYLRAAPDSDRNVDRTEVETILRRVVGQLQNVDVRAGQPDLTRTLSGEPWVYDWPNSSNSFAYIVVYPDRASRDRPYADDPLAAWRTPVARRGVGNVLVLIGSEDANFRYRVIAALDDLAN